MKTVFQIKYLSDTKTLGLIICVILILSFKNNSAQNTSNVIFNFDVSYFPFFNPEEDTIYLSADFPENNWPVPGSSEVFMLTDPDEDRIYSLSLELEIGDYSYGYWYNSGWDCSDLDYIIRFFSVSEINQTIELNDEPMSYMCYYLINFHVHSDDGPIENAAVDFEQFETKYTDNNGEVTYQISYAYECNVEYAISANGYYPVSGNFETSFCDYDIFEYLSMVRTSVINIPNSEISYELIKGNLYVNSDKNYIFKIYNVIGNLVYQSEAKTGSNTFNINHLNSGCYIFELTNGTQRITEKFILH